MRFVATNMKFEARPREWPINNWSDDPDNEGDAENVQLPATMNLPLIFLRLSTTRRLVVV